MTLIFDKDDTQKVQSRRGIEAGLASQLAEFGANIEYGHLPQTVVREAKRTILNSLGAALGARSHEVIQIVLDVYGSSESIQRSSTEATIIGRFERAGIMAAALINAMMAHVLDFDDTHPKTMIKPAAPILYGPLAIAETRHLSGERFLAAAVVGIEVALRIGLVLYPSHYQSGWHITATAGTVGAAIGSGKALGLNKDRLSAAIGISTVHAAGLREMFGTHCKALQVGNAAANGLRSALLAAQGLSCASLSLEGQYGYFRAASHDPQFSQLTYGLGEQWEILHNTYKPFACGVVIHPIIEAILDLRCHKDLVLDEIQHIEIRANPIVLELTGNRAPASGLEGKFSVYYSVAIAMLDGEASPRQYTDDLVEDPRVRALQRRIEVRADSQFRPDEAEVQVILANGRRLARHVEHTRGSLANPLSDEDLVNKFLNLAEPVVGISRARALAQTVQSLEAVRDMGILVAQLAEGVFTGRQANRGKVKIKKPPRQIP